MRLIYFILTLFTFVVLIQIFWPLIFVFGILIIAFISYVRYKAKQAMKDTDTYYSSTYDDTHYTNTNTNQTSQDDDSNIEKPIQQGSVIDAEYTERSQDDDRN
ncbi:hypothetical protein [Anaerorhabdus sp.]|uniref:hypothetical protein n=1 Tax=Anaerorhabdus sp. TaxID=1872524 RepID=UPI002FC95142